ncbi:MAG: hypothetical protein ACE5IR_09555 [bacterium]
MAEFEYTQRFLEPFSGSSDPDLPENVKKLSKQKRERWIGAFNGAFGSYKKENDKQHDPDKSFKANREAFAFRVANATLKESMNTLENVARISSELDGKEISFNECSIQFLEAKSSDGSEWEVVVIEEGKSKNPPPHNFFYTKEALESAVPLVNQAKAFAYEFKGTMRNLFEHLPDKIREAKPEGLAQNMVGFFKDAKLTEFKRDGQNKRGIVATFVATADWLKEQLRNAWQKGKKDLFGFSIDGEGPPPETGFIEGLGIVPLVKQISKLNEVTVVTEGAAASGRQFLRLLNSNMTVNQLKEMVMKDKLLEMIRQKDPKLLEGKKVEELTDDDISQLLESALTQTDVKPEKLKEVKGLQELMGLLGKGDFSGARKLFNQILSNPKSFGYPENRSKESIETELNGLLEAYEAKGKLAESEKKSELEKKDEEDVKDELKETVQTLAESVKALVDKEKYRESVLSIDAKVKESKLPESSQTRLRESFSGKDLTEEEINHEIKLEQEHVARLSESGKVIGLGDANRIEVGDEDLDKYRLAMDGFFEGEAQKGEDGKKINPFRSLKEAYRYICGDPWAGDDPAVIMQESFNFVPKLPDAPGFAPSYDYRRRMAMREAFRSNRLRESLTTSSFGEILGDSVTRKMIKDYTLAEKIVDARKIVSLWGASIGDFRTQRRMKLGGYGTLSTVSQAQTYPSLTSPTDAEETYAVSKKGGLEDLTIEMIADDDVGAIRAIPRRLARAAVETLYRGVFDLLTANATMNEDSITLFNASHNNTGITALADAEVAVVRGLMRSQTAYGNTSEVLGESNAPKFIVVPNELEQTAWQLQSSPVVVSAALTATVPNINRAKYVIEPVIVDYYTNAKDHFYVADPKKQPTIEVGFFQGRQEPELFVSDNPTVGSTFTADKISYKIRHIWGVTVLDWRSFYFEDVA